MLKFTLYGYCISPLIGISENSIYVTVDCVRNMVIALREMSFHGDFRTTVEYLIVSETW